MASKTTGIQKQADGTFILDKVISGERFRNGGFKSFKEANEFVAKQVHHSYTLNKLGKRPPMTFDAAAAHYINWSGNKTSLISEVFQLKSVMPFISHLDIKDICDETLNPYVEFRLTDGKAHKTINLTLGVIRHILNLCVDEFKYKNKLSWLEEKPKITFLSLVGHQRTPRPITWMEQADLLKLLPPHLKRMTLFTVNAGVRDNVTCNLRWSWEIPIEELGVSIFVVPKKYVKGEDEKKQDQIIVCNSVSQAAVEEARGLHNEFVFVYRRERADGKPPKGKYRPVETMNNTAWQNAREAAGLGDLHVHDLRHTTGQRLREAHVEHRTIASILWHAGGDITSHYTTAQIAELATALEAITKDAGTWNRTIDQLRREMMSHRKVTVEA
jgi:integrase